MKKRDRAFKRKGFRQVPLGSDGAIETNTTLKNGRAICRAWGKLDVAHYVDTGQRRYNVRNAG